MTGREHVERVLNNLKSLGPKRLVALALIAILTLSVVAVGASYLAEPKREVLYTGLDRDDVTRIGNVLSGANVTFDVAPDGGAILVAPADTAPARRLLAEHGLPQSPNAGYELFDGMSSFGLTSFMQEVTRVRALEGELARTIQEMQGITAARVHIVMPDRGSFRREQRPASAAVVIRTESTRGDSQAEAIRHLVAGAIPGMEIGGVTVLDTRGSVLASGDDPAHQSTGRLARLQSETNQGLEEQIRKTLVPFLGVQNFTVSVTSRLNIDKTVESATTYYPDAKVERSVRTVREEQSARNQNLDEPVTVQQNIPQEEPPAACRGARSTQDSSRREEITNYEIPTRVVETVRDGFAIERLSIAVLVNRSQLEANAALENGTPIDTQVSYISALVRTAAGFAEARGDQLEVAAIPFANGGDLEPVPAEGFLAAASRQLGTVVNAAIILVVAVLLIWFGLRPAISALTARREDDPVAALIAATGAGTGEEGANSLLDDLKAKMGKNPQHRLEQVVDYDPEKAAALLKQWLLQGERA